MLKTLKIVEFTIYMRCLPLPVLRGSKYPPVLNTCTKICFVRWLCKCWGCLHIKKIHINVFHGKPHFFRKVRENIYRQKLWRSTHQREKSHDQNSAMSPPPGQMWGWIWQQLKKSRGFIMHQCPGRHWNGGVCKSFYAKNSVLEWPPHLPWGKALQDFGNSSLPFGICL